MHRTALGKGPKVDSCETDAVDQIDHDLLGFPIISYVKMTVFGLCDE